MPDFLRAYRVRITPLSPVHVGSGERVEPFEYVLQGDELWVLSPARLLELLDPPDLERYLAALEKGPFEARRALAEIAERGDLRPAIAWRAPVRRGFKNYLERAFRTGQGELALRVFPRSLRGPYLPGSSLKGALRTVFLFDQSRKDLKADFNEETFAWEGSCDLRWVPEERDLFPGRWLLTPGQGRIRAPLRLRRPRGREKRSVQKVNVRFEARLLRNPHPKRDADILRDPLRTLLVADSSPIGGTELRLVDVVGSRKRPGEQTGIRQLVEVWTEGAVEADLRFHRGMQARLKQTAPRRGIRAPCEEDPTPPLPHLRELAAAAYERYIDLAEEELHFFEDRGLDKAARKMAAILEAIDDLLDDDNAFKEPLRFPLRLGYGAGEKSMRLAEFIEFEGPRGAQRINPVSRKLAEGEPLGWVMVEVLGGCC